MILEKFLQPLTTPQYALLLCSILLLTSVTTGADQKAKPPKSRDLAPPADPALPSLFIIGDSTVRNGNGTGGNGEWGWGDFLAPYFNPTAINVANNALGGTSSRTFYRDRWPGIKAMIKPGDFVILQFGHNDASPVNEAVRNASARARGTLPGTGPDIQCVTNILTRRFEVVHTFGWYEKQFILETRARGAQPIICSLIPRNSWKDGQVVRHADTYAGWAEAVARSEYVPFVDLNELVSRRYETLGKEAVNRLFVPGAGPHTSKAGAELNAECVVSALKALPLNPLAPFFSTKAKAVTPATKD